MGKNVRAPIQSGRVKILHSTANNSGCLCLFHPDYTVGIGIAPIREQPPPFFADFTAGEELHLAPKLMIFLTAFIIFHFVCIVKQNNGLQRFYQGENDVERTPLTHFTVHTEQEIVPF